MFEALVLGCLLAAIAIGGKVILVGMATMPLVGGFASWYVGAVGQLPDGITANLIYGAMAAQVILLPLAAVLYGPRLVRRLVKPRAKQGN